MFKNNIILAIDPNGYLWYIQISTNGKIIFNGMIGKIWDKFSLLVAVGKYLLAIDQEGNFWKFDFDTDHYWLVE